MKKTLLFLGILSLFAMQLSYAQSCDPVNTYANPANGTYADKGYRKINCHAYVRTALLNNGVDLNTGKYKSFPNLSTNGSWISDDDRFVKVCNPEYAQAISFSGLNGGLDHSSLVLHSAPYAPLTFASVAGYNSSVVTHGQAGVNTSGTGVIRYNYYAVLPKFINDNNNNLGANSSRTYTLEYKGYVESINWSVTNPSSLSITAADNRSVTVKATCGSGSGNYELIAKLRIKGSPSGEYAYVKKTITVDCPTSTSSCFNNTLDNNNLNTFNYVSAGNEHKILMELSWSWNKSWGSTSSWYTKNGGREMYFTLPYGGATFTATNGSCGTHTYTFYASGGYYKSTADVKGHTPFKVYSLITGRIVRTGFLEDYNGKSPLKLLPNGFYVLHIHDTKQKIYVNNN